MTVSDDILKAFAMLATPTIANALDDVAFEGVMQASPRSYQAPAASAAPSPCARPPASAATSRPPNSRSAT